MNTELKEAIIKHMIGNKDFQLVNNTFKKFRQYIYNPDGSYCFGGQAVYNFITAFDSLLRM